MRFLFFNYPNRLWINKIKQLNSKKGYFFRKSMSVSMTFHCTYILLLHIQLYYKEKKTEKSLIISKTKRTFIVFNIKKCLNIH